MRLLLFNPDNDLALANFSPGFTPPATIQGMIRDLQRLPEAWAELGDVVLTNAEWKMQNSAFENVEVLPWGWSPAVCHHLRTLGVPAALLPSKKQLQEIRRLSSREGAVQLLHEMQEDGLCEGFDSEFCISEAKVEAALARWPRTILKAPWSGSGKGLRYGQGGREDTLAGWYRRVLQQQGGVVVEPIYNKVYDLAMEFWSDGQGHVTYQGLSLFETHPNGAYRGNLLLSEAEKDAWLARFVPASQTLALRQWLECRLSQLLDQHYRGPLGIDMMLVSPSASVATSLSSSDCVSFTVLGGSVAELVLHPMVELNLRMTMGYVSLLLSRRQSKDYRGLFRLDYFPSTADLQADDDRLRSTNPSYQVLAMGDHYRAYIIKEAANELLAARW